MLINLDYRKRTSIYEQIVSEVERYVSVGALEKGEKIPSVRSLASELGINPNTIKKAYDILEEKGVIVTYSTKGTFVSENTDKLKQEKREELLEEVMEKIKELKNLGLSNKEILEKIEKKCKNS